MISGTKLIFLNFSNLNKYKTGELKNGSYSAFYSFVFKAAISFALLVSGIILSFIGFDTGAEQHSNDVIWNLGAAMLLVGPIVCIFAAFAISKNRITKDFLNLVRAQASN